MAQPQDSTHPTFLSDKQKKTKTCIFNLPGPPVPDASTFITAPIESRHLLVLMKPCEPFQTHEYNFYQLEMLDMSRIQRWQNVIILHKVQ